jgi:hypothetical protein
MQIYKRVSYVRVTEGWQTYIYPISGGFLRYKLIVSSEALALAIDRCEKTGWQMHNATNLVRQLSAPTKSRSD